MKNLLKIITAALTLLFAVNVNAAVVGFVNNPTSNSTDWASAVTSAGGTINSNVNFDALSTGAFDSTFYQGTDGVSFSTSGAFGGVFNGAGPGQANTGGSIIGEGIHAASNYLQGGSQEWSLTASFTSAISGFGLSVIDLFASETLTLEAFTGIDGTGTSLGLFTGIDQNFQRNGTYFLGLLSDSVNIRSVVFTDLNGGTGDIIGVDDIVFTDVSPVPVPAAAWLFGSALLGFFGFSRRNKKA